MSTHVLLASQEAVFERKLTNQERILPKMLGIAIPIFDAKYESILAIFLRADLTIDSGFGSVGGLPPLLPPPRANTNVETSIPTAVRRENMVLPCSLNNVRRRSASVVSSWRIQLIVSFIRFICVLSLSLVDEAASNLDFLSS